MVVVVVVQMVVVVVVVESQMGSVGSASMTRRGKATCCAKRTGGSRKVRPVRRAATNGSAPAIFVTSIPRDKNVPNVRQGKNLRTKGNTVSMGYGTTRKLWVFSADIPESVRETSATSQGVDVVVARGGARNVNPTL